MMKKVLLVLGVAVGLIIVVNQAKAQDKNLFMHGKVTTLSGDSYEGPIRWGTDEVYWMELFNAEKTSNDFLKHLSRKEREELSEQEGESKSWLNLESIWIDRTGGSTHRFDCRFGDIKSIEPVRGDRARLTLKNGVILEVYGGGTYEDVGTSVRVYDFELGEVPIKWSRIEKIDFYDPGTEPAKQFGEPIFGRVNAGRRGVFEGIIRWDRDERFGHEELDGDGRNGRMEIPFRSITKIERGRDGANVTLKSGREYYLTGTNDVNSGNRGIYVYNHDIGEVVIPWKYFEEMEVIAPDNIGLSYSEFPVSKGLSATVVTIEGDEYEGLIAFDIDEAWEFEILDGKDDDVVYKIPFRNIKSIVPRNSSYSNVTLRNGERLLLGDERDVSSNNDGVLIFTSNDERPKRVRWSKIDEIIFD